MLTSVHLNEKSGDALNQREVTSSLDYTFIGQATEHAAIE